MIEVNSRNVFHSSILFFFCSFKNSLGVFCQPLRNHTHQIKIWNIEIEENRRSVKFLFTKMNLQSFHFAKCWKFPSTPLFEMENFGKLLCKRAPWTQWMYAVQMCACRVATSGGGTKFVVAKCKFGSILLMWAYWKPIMGSYYDSDSDSDSNSTTAAIAKKRSSPIYVHRFVLYLFSIFSIAEAVAVPLPLGSVSFPFSFLCSRLNFPIN